MEKEDARYFAGLMEDFLSIPAFVCEKIEINLIQGNYKEVVEFVIKRKRCQEKEHSNNELVKSKKMF